MEIKVVDGKVVSHSTGKYDPHDDQAVLKFCDWFYPGDESDSPGWRCQRRSVGQGFRAREEIMDHVLAWIKRSIDVVPKWKETSKDEYQNENT